jgi:hypothetical protein
MWGNLIWSCVSVVYLDVTRQAKGLYRLKHVGALWCGLAYLSRYNSGWFCHIFLTGAPPPPSTAAGSVPRRWAALVHPFPTQGCNQVWFGPLMPLPPSPSLSATLVAEIWPAAAIPLHKGPSCFIFNISREFSVESQGSFGKPQTRTCKPIYELWKCKMIHKKILKI